MRGSPGRRIRAAGTAKPGCRRLVHRVGRIFIERQIGQAFAVTAGPRWGYEVSPLRLFVRQALCQAGSLSSRLLVKQPPCQAALAAVIAGLGGGLSCLFDQEM